MLKILRKNTKVIIWIVVTVFILWGGFSVGVQFTTKDRFAGEIFSKKVSLQEFKRFYQASQIFSLTDQPVEDPNLLRYQAWQNLIYAREAKRLKIDVPDSEVLSEISRILESQGIGNPTPENYKRWLRATVRINPHEFETMIREMIRIQKLVRSVREQPIDPPTREEALREFLRDNRKIHLEMAKFSSRDEASELSNKIMTPEDWNLATTALPSPPAKGSGMITFKELLQTLPMPRETAEELYLMTQGSTSDPIPLGNEYTVFYLADKAESEESDFIEKEEEYFDHLTNLRQQMKFFEWHLTLMARANLQDYWLEKEASKTPKDSK